MGKLKLHYYLIGRLACSDVMPFSKALYKLSLVIAPTKRLRELILNSVQYQPQSYATKLVSIRKKQYE